MLRQIANPKHATYLLFAAMLSAIWINCEKIDDPVMGPCEHRYLDPLIVIDPVTEMTTGRQIMAFKIVDVTIDDNEIDLHQLLHDSASNCVLYDSVLYCNTPTGFGTQEGNYQLTIQASGFQDTTISFSAAYQTFDGGCPSSSSGSTPVSLQLKKR